MDWAMVGAIGEVLGAAAVVVTLVYLSRQIRSSARAMRQAGMQEILGQTGEFLDSLSSSPKTAGLWAKGLSGDQELTRDEQIWVGVQMYRWATIVERLHYMAEANQIDPWVIDNNLTVRSEIFSTPGFRAWYSQRGHWLSESFRSRVEQETGLGSYERFSLAAQEAPHSSDPGGPA